MVDQNSLPFEFKIYESKDYHLTCQAIVTMITRGAGAIGAAAGYAMAQAFIEGGKYEGLDERVEGEKGDRKKRSSGWKAEQLWFFQNARQEIEASRPTARNLFYATEKVYEAGMISVADAVKEAQRLADENLAAALGIGQYGNVLIKDGFRILTHCNAGWLGFVDYGSALSPVYVAHEQGKKLFVSADETRPRSQGARLTAWELMNEGIPHAIVPDNAGAFLMSKGLVDMVIVGADRIAANGETAHKIRTFEKAIVPREFGIPFYVAAPLSTFDFMIPDGNHIIIEERSEEEVHYQSGPDEEGIIRRIRVTAPGSPAVNPAFDVTPAAYITGIITEKGIIKPGVKL